MATLLYRLGKNAFRRWPIFLAAWLIAIVGLGALAATVAKPMSDAMSIPGIPSEKAADIQQELFPEAGDAFEDASVNLVVAAPEGHTLAEPAYQAAIQELIDAVPTLPQTGNENPGLVAPAPAAEGMPAAP